LRPLPDVPLRHPRAHAAAAGITSWNISPVPLFGPHAPKRRFTPEGGFAMTRTIIAALALSLGLGTAALAQSSTTTTGADTSTSGSVTLPQAWQGDIAGTFFSDPTAGTLKSDDEIKSGWSKLSADQQAQVKSDCQSHMASATTGSGASTDKTQTSSTSTNTMASGSTSTGGGASAGGSADMTASLDKLCGAIQGM
jgi:hypothetical protein